MRALRAFFLPGEGEAGQAILLVAATMLGMLMMVGLAIDAGQLYSARRTMQEAADAGAYAGAVVLYQQGTQAEARAAAVRDVAVNGYVNGLNGFTVTVNAPPTSGPYTNNNLYVEVIISGNVQTALVPGQSTLSFVRVRGVGGSEPLNNEYAIMSLDRGATGCAFTTTANANIELTGGGILVNSSSNTAACNGQEDENRFRINPAPPHGVDINGGTSSVWPDGMDVDTGQPQQADPFAGFPKPSTSCIPDVTPCTPMPVYNAIPPSKVLDPGVWTVTLVGSGNDTLILRPGVYVLKGGTNGTGNSDLISADALTTPQCLSACGVFLFNTHTNYPNAFRPGIDTCGPMNLAGNGTSRLAPMTTGTYKGFLIYQDSACTNGMTISGNGSFNGSGTIYLPGATFTLNGNNATLTGSQLVASRVNLQNGNLAINFTAGSSAQPILPRLAE